MQPLVRHDRPFRDRRRRQLPRGSRAERAGAADERGERAGERAAPDHGFASGCGGRTTCTTLRRSSVRYVRATRCTSAAVTAR